MLPRFLVKAGYKAALIGGSALKWHWHNGRQYGLFVTRCGIGLMRGVSAIRFPIRYAWECINIGKGRHAIFLPFWITDGYVHYPAKRAY